jgi:hypothetical protein
VFCFVCVCAFHVCPVYCPSLFMSIRCAVSANGHLTVDWVHQLTSIELNYSCSYVDVCCNCLELNEMFAFGSPVVPDSWHDIV